MSDLVEKVTRAFLGLDHLTDQQWAPHWKAIQRNGITPPKAKRAIAAVAEWMSAAIHPEENAYHVREELLKQLEQPK